MSDTASAPHRRKMATPAALVASVALHAVIIAASARYIRTLAAREAPPIAVELSPSADPPTETPPRELGASGAPEQRVEEPKPSAMAGTTNDPRPDTRTTGHGGTREAAEKALHLSDSVDGLTLDTDPTLLTPLSQLSRIDTGKERLSREDRRTTPHPMELTFLAVGSGSRLARLPFAPEDPSLGAQGAVPVTSGDRRRARRPT